MLKTKRRGREEESTLEQRKGDGCDGPTVTIAWGGETRKVSQRHRRKSRNARRHAPHWAAAAVRRREKG